MDTWSSSSPDDQNDRDITILPKPARQRTEDDPNRVTVFKPHA